MARDAAFWEQATHEVTAMMESFRSLRFEDVVARPEAVGDEVLIGDERCAFTIFRQSLDDENQLLTVQMAAQGVMGVASYHFERGLVFARNGQVRDAAETELLDSGG